MQIKVEDGKLFDVTDSMYKVPIKPHFPHFKNASMYKQAGIKAIEPMTAKEIGEEDKQDLCLGDSSYIIEEKFDGTRALLYFLKTKEFKEKYCKTHDEYVLKSILLYWVGTMYSHLRIYTSFVQGWDLPIGKLVPVLKEEFGVSGGTTPFGIVSYSSKGCHVIEDVPGQKDKDLVYMWSAVVVAIKELIEQGFYYPQEAYTRVFSRRVSTKTGWYTENTDLLPQLRGLNNPELAGTILDGEMFIDGRSFEDASGTMNCKWDKAVARQSQIGFLTLHAFDILFYKGIDLRKMPLSRRKVYLHLAVEQANTPYIKEVDYYHCGGRIPTHHFEETHGTTNALYSKLKAQGKEDVYPNFVKDFEDKKFASNLLSPRGFYEYIIATGGEGVMVKPIDGKYFSKRGREYQKIKAFLTREVIILGFTQPTREYTGKFATPDKWNYWEDKKTGALYAVSSLPCIKEVIKSNLSNYIPVTENYYKGLIENIRFGVIITNEEIDKLPNKKKFNIEEHIIENQHVKILEVGECGGINNEQRFAFSCNAKESEDGKAFIASEEEIEDNGLIPVDWVGTVIEVKANALFKDTGKLRHPRFLRIRNDKSPLACTFADHVQD